jgi:hypothetical protein
LFFAFSSDMEGSAAKKLKAFNESLVQSCREVWPAGEARAVIKKMSERNKERSAWLLDEDLVEAIQTVMHDTMGEATDQILVRLLLFFALLARCSLEATAGRGAAGVGGAQCGGDAGRSGGAGAAG